MIQSPVRLVSALGHPLKHEACHHSLSASNGQERNNNEEFKERFMIAKILMAMLLVFSAGSAWAQSPIDGSWDFTMSSQMGSVAAKVTMKVEGETLTGEFDLGGGRKWLIEQGTAAGSDIAFVINRDGAAFTYAMKGSVEGNQVKGAASAMGSVVEWSMTRAQ
jgi:hypothetical protein